MHHETILSIGKEGNSLHAKETNECLKDLETED